MKKQNAIVALLLIVSLLVSSMTIFVGAAGSDDGANTAGSGTSQDTVTDELPKMIETLVTTKSGKFTAAGRPVYAMDSMSSIVPNALDGINTVFTIGNTVNGIGVFDMYDIQYGDDSFMRINPNAEGIADNGGKLRNNVYFGISSAAYGYFNMSSVVGDYEASMSSVDGYFVYDVELATEYLIPGFNMMPIIRVGIDGSYTLAAQTSHSLDTYASYLDGGKWAHFTYVGDIKNNTRYLFINGKYVGSSKILSSFPDDTVKYTSIRFEGLRISTTSPKANENMNLYLDNMGVRFYTGAQAASAGLEAAIESKKIANFTDHYADKGTVLPPIATVNGVVCNTAAEVGSIVSGNTDTPYQVDILRKFPSIVNINADAVVNTHGFVGLSNFTFPEGAHYEMEDGYLTVDAPFVSNSYSQVPTSGAGYVNAAKSQVEGNWTSGISRDPLSSVRVLTNMDNAKQCVELNFLTTSINQIDISTGATRKDNKIDDYSYVVFSFDLVSFSNTNGGAFFMLGRSSAGPRNLGGHLYFKDILSGLPTGTVAQVTVVLYETSTDHSYNVIVFRDGKLLENVKTSFTVSDKEVSENMYVEAFRLFPTGGHFAMDNIYSVVSDTPVLDAEGNLLDEYNQFNKPGYDKLSLPSVATVDGVPVAAVAQVSNILNTNALVYQQNVVILNSFTGKMEIGVSAVIETNGFVGLDSFTFADGVTYVQDGTKIITTAPLNITGQVTTEKLPSTGSYKFTLSEATTPDNQHAYDVQVSGEGTYLDVKTITSAYNGNKYYGIVTNPDYLATNSKTSANKYIRIQTNKTYAVDVTAGGIDDILATANEEYFVFDVDISTENNYFSNFDIVCTPRWCNENGGIVGWANSSGISLMKSVKAEDLAGGWIHVTIVGDVKNNTRHIYINGEHRGTAAFVNTAPATDKLDKIKGVLVHDIRLNIPEGVTIKADMSLYFDNISLRSFGADETALIDAVKNKSSLTGWDKNHEGKTTEGEMNIAASVDGTPFSNVEEAVKYAMDNKARQLSIYDEYTGLLNVSHDISIYVKNGTLNYLTKTHKVTVDGGLYTFTKADKNELNTLYVVYDRFAFESNGGIGGYEAVQFGNGSQFAYENESFVANTYYNGKYYTFNGKWQYETNEGYKEFTGVVTADCSYKLLIPQYDTVEAECTFSYKLNGGEIVLANGTDELVALLNGEYETLEISIYEDVKLANIAVTGALTIDLNGNDLIFTSLDSAAFALVADNTSLVINSSKAGAGIYYAGEKNGALTSAYLVAIEANGTALTVNGRNISVYAGALVTDNTGKTNNTVTVNGGTYYRTAYEQLSYVTVKGGMKVNVNGATFVDTASNGAWFASHNEAEAEFDGAEIVVNNATVIGLEGTALISEAQDKNGNCVPMSFNALTYLANGGKFSTDAGVLNAKVGTGSYTNVVIPEGALVDGYKLIYQNKNYTLKLYYPAYLNGGAADALDYTLTESTYSATAIYKVGTPYALSVNGMKYNLTLYSHFNINLYIPVSEAAKFIDGTFDGAKITVLEGVEYYVFTKSVNANAVGDDVEFRFTLVNNEAYVVTLNIAEYAEDILSKTSITDTSYTPILMVSMLEYASSVYAFEGNDNSELLAIIAKYEKYKTTTEDFGATVNTAPLAQFLTSASMYLNDSPSFIFKLNDSFVGTVKVECGNITKTVDSAQSKTILLGGVRITDIQDTITLTFTAEGAEPVVCTYNLATYYQGVSANDAAGILLNALRNYSNVANLYMADSN